MVRLRGCAVTEALEQDVGDGAGRGVDEHPDSPDLDDETVQTDVAHAARQ